MLTIASNHELRDLHRRALRSATDVVQRVRAVDLGRATPCAGWDLAALLGHMVGQNHGFAQALRYGDAPASAFASCEVAGDPVLVWRDSAQPLSAAVDSVPGERAVRLVEISDDRRFPAAVAIGFQLLDTVVHGWDVATALGLDHRPDDDLVAVTLRIARGVPGGAARRQPGAAFGPEREATPGDDWSAALALVGRG